MKTPDNYIREVDLGLSAAPDPHNSMYRDIPLLADKLNHYLTSVFDTQERLVVISSLVGLDGLVNLRNSNKVVITFLTMNVEQTATEKLQVLEILVSANFDDSHDALCKLSAVADFFQLAIPGGEVENLADGSRLSVDKLDKGIAELAEIFKLVGANYIPSLVYRVVKPLINVMRLEGVNSINETNL